MSSALETEELIETLRALLAAVDRARSDTTQSSNAEYAANVKRAEQALTHYVKTRGPSCK